MQLQHFLGCVTRPRAQRRVTQPRKSLLADLCTRQNIKECNLMKFAVLYVHNSGSRNLVLIFEFRQFGDTETYLR